jgi:hypothetical protein
MSGNVTFSGNVTVSGTSFAASATTITTGDSLISMATSNNSSDAVDIGFYGLYDTSGSQDLYSGIFRDADSSGKWRLFKDLQVQPTTTVNVSGAGYAVATLVANVEGAVTGNASTATTLATARNIGGVSFDGSAAINLPGVNTSGNQDTSGNAATATTATALATGRTIGMTGDVVWTSASFTGAGNVTGTSTIQANAVESAMIAENNVTTREIAANAVTSALIAQNSILTKHIDDGQVNTAQLAGNSVTAAKIQANAVAASEIAQNSIGVIHIPDGLITATQLAANSVDSAELITGSIDAIHLASSSVTTAKIADNAVTAAKVAANVIGSSELAQNSVTATHIPSGTITADLMGSNSVDSDELVNGSIDAGHISTSAVTTAKIADNAVTTAKIATNSITNLMIADDAVTGAKIDGSSDIAVASLQTTGNVTAGNGTGDKMIVSGLLGVQDTNPPQKLHIDEVGGFDVATLSSSSTGQQTVDSFAAATFRTAKYLISITNSTDGDYQALELLLFHDGTTVYLTQYASIFDNGAQVTFDADINSGSVRLRATPASTDNMTIKVIRQAIEV